MVSFKDQPEKIRDVIGKGGATHAPSRKKPATINVEDDGTVTIASPTWPASKKRRRIELITAEVEAGQIYEGTVQRLLEFGAIVQLLPGRTGFSTSRRSPTNA